MPVTDPIADVLTRIRNANRALHEETQVPTSTFSHELLRILKEQGFIRSYEPIADSWPRMTKVQLKYRGAKRERVITDLKRVSKPGLRVYKGASDIPRVLKGLGVAVVSTSQGVMTDSAARDKGIGGEIICYVW